MLRYSTRNWLLQAAIDFLDTGVMPEDEMTPEEKEYFDSSVKEIKEDRANGLIVTYSVGDYDDD